MVPGQVVGKIVAFSQQGNLISDISAEQLQPAPRDESVVIRCDEHETNCLFDCQHNQPEATLIAVIGSSGHLELEIVGDSAKIMLGVPLGEKITVQW
jgi:S-adenosylmethionine hydrolase